MQRSAWGAADGGPGRMPRERRGMARMMRFGAPVQFGEGHEEWLELRNFHPPEPGGFSWSAGRWCEVSFPMDPAALGPQGHVLLELDFDAFRQPPILRTQDVLVYLNGLRLGALVLRGRQQASFRLRRSTLEATENVLAVDVPDAARPVDFGHTDGRLLGLKLFSMLLEPAPSA